MQAWIDRVLAAPHLGVTALAALLVLGAFSAVASTCCSLPVIGAITGYVGASEANRRRDITIAALSFLVGATLTLAVLGAAMGYAGHLVGAGFSRYSKLAVGFVLVFLGLLSLGLFPFRLPALRAPSKTTVPGALGMPGALGAMALGSVLGGSSATCAVSCCSPALLAILGVVALRGEMAKGALLMGVFGLGFSIPLVAVLLGISLGKWTLRATRAMPVVKIVAGALMLGLGFYFLASI